MQLIDSLPHPRRIVWVLGAAACIIVVHFGWAQWSSRPPLRAEVAYDIVMSYYNEDVAGARDTMHHVVEALPPGATSRRIIYVKGELGTEKREELQELADELIKVDNVGREGETYLSHIVNNYHAPDMADHTIFIQPHLAWAHIMVPRLQEVTKGYNIGFMSFGPYVQQTCGKDSSGNVFSRMADIYSMFRQDFCPPHPVLATWAGQFIVSRKRIHQNSLKQYQNLLDKFHAPPDHWIWQEGWGNNELSNPTLGHALERTWPVIFDCSDASISEKCGDDVVPECRCMD